MRRRAAGRPDVRADRGGSRGTVAGNGAGRASSGGAPEHRRGKRRHRRRRAASCRRRGLPLRDRARQTDRAHLEAGALRGGRGLDRRRNSGSGRSRRQRGRVTAGMRVTVRLFARLKDVVGAGELARRWTRRRVETVAARSRPRVPGACAVYVIYFGRGQRRVRAHGRAGCRWRRSGIPATGLRRRWRTPLGVRTKQCSTSSTPSRHATTTC